LVYTGRCNNNIIRHVNFVKRLDDSLLVNENNSLKRFKYSKIISLSTEVESKTKSAPVDNLNEIKTACEQLSKTNSLKVESNSFTDIRKINFKVGEKHQIVYTTAPNKVRNITIIKSYHDRILATEEDGIPKIFLFDKLKALLTAPEESSQNIKLSVEPVVNNSTHDDTWDDMPELEEINTIKKRPILEDFNRVNKPITETKKTVTITINAELYNRFSVTYCDKYISVLMRNAISGHIDPNMLFGHIDPTTGHIDPLVQN
jgi:hypothetical protein